MSTLYDIINILPVSMLSVILFGVCVGMPEKSILGFALCLAFSVWMIILRNMKRKNRLRNTGIVAVFVIGLLIAAGDENRQLFIKDYLWVVWVLCISVAAITVGIFMSRNILIKRAVAAVLLVYCVVGTILGWEISKEAFALICFILLVRIAEEIQRRWKKSGDADIRGHITRIAPVFLAACLVVYFVPAPDEPYDWQLAKDIYNSAATFISRIYGFIAHPSDDYGSIGFSDKGGFLSGLGSSDEEVLFITAGNTTVKDFRLVGCISGDFTGREWVFDTESADEGVSRMIDTLETACAVNKYSGAAQSDYLQMTDMHYETLFYNTRYIFSPAKIRVEATKQKTPDISERNGSIVSNRRLNHNDNYLISCYVLNYSNPGLADLLDSAAPIGETEWNKAAKAEYVTDEQGYSYEDYGNYRKDVYQSFCHNYGVSEKVEEILDLIKDGSENRYETLKRLEAYLKKMEYSTDCGPLPDSVNDAKSFLDYFLLNSRKGYCMHYATAFTLMANEMGIPCRYVQGYSVKRDINGDLVVNQSNAHAWPEAYFDNVGWVAFEPTPGFSVPVGWGKRAETAYEYDIPDPVTDENEDETSDLSGIPGEEAPGIDPLIFIIPSLAVVSFLLLFYITGRSAARKKYKLMAPKDKFGYLTQQNLRFLKLLGFGMETGETLSEFSGKIMRSDREEVKELIGFIPVYETVLYSDREIGAEDVTAAENTHNALRELVKKSKLRFRLMLMIKKQ